MASHAIQPAKPRQPRRRKRKHKWKDRNVGEPLHHRLFTRWCEASNPGPEGIATGFRLSSFMRQIGFHHSRGGFRGTDLCGPCLSSTARRASHNLTCLKKGSKKTSTSKFGWNKFVSKRSIRFLRPTFLRVLGRRSGHKNNIRLLQVKTRDILLNPTHIIHTYCRNPCQTERLTMPIKCVPCRSIR